MPVSRSESKSVPNCVAGSMVVECRQPLRPASSTSEGVLGVGLALFGCFSIVYCSFKLYINDIYYGGAELLKVILLYD